MRRRGRAPLTITFLAAGCASVASPERHVGPVTGVVTRGNVVWSCSQAGVFTGVGPELRPFCVPPFRATSLAPLPDGGLLVGGGEPARSGELARYDRAGSLVARARVADDLVYGIDSDGTSVVVAGADGRVQVLGARLDTPHAVHAHAGPARAVRIVPAGTEPALVVSVGRDARILATPLAGGPTLAIVDHTGGVECLDSTCEDGKTLLWSGARDGKVRVHELGAGKARLVRTWQRLGAPVQALCARQGIFVGLANGELRARDDHGELTVVATLPGAITALAAGEHGDLLAGTDGELAVVHRP